MLKLLPDFSTLTIGQRKTAKIYGALFFTPFLILMLIQIYNALLLAHVGSDVAYVQNVWKSEARALSDQVEPASLKSAQARNAYGLVVAHDEMLPERNVTLTLEIPLTEMRNLKNRPDRPLEELESEAAAQTQEIALNECAVLRQQLASDCVVISANGRSIGQQNFQYQLQLAFVEATPFGKTNQTDTYDLVVSKLLAGKAATGRKVYFKKSGAQRKKIYAAIAETCKSMRKKVGNCSVTGISLSSILEPGLPMVRLAASATFASLVKKDVVASSQGK